MYRLNIFLDFRSYFNRKIITNIHYLFSTKHCKIVLLRRYIVTFRLKLEFKNKWKKPKTL